MTIASENPTDKMQDMLCSLSRNWWAFVLRGVLALIIAVLAFVMPAEALLALTLVFGAFAFTEAIPFSMAATQTGTCHLWGVAVYTRSNSCSAHIRSKSRSPLEYPSGLC